MFDEFMKELRRRQAEATGGSRPRTAPGGEEDSINPNDPKPMFADDATTRSSANDTNNNPTQLDPNEPKPKPEPIQPFTNRGPRRDDRPP